MKKLLFFIFLLFFTYVYAEKTGIFSYIPFKTAEWTSKITTESPSEKATLIQNVFYKENKMRIEGKDKDGNQYVTIIDNKYVYIINPKEKQGVKYPIMSKQNPEKNNIELNKCREKAKKTGNEKINDKNCEIYEFDCSIDGINFKIKEWKSVKDNFVIKTETVYEKTKTISEIVDLKTGIKISDNNFIPDKNIKFIDMENLMLNSFNKEKDEKKIKEMMKNFMKDMGSK